MRPIICALALLLADFAKAQQFDPAQYASSPPVYPSPNITGTGGWAGALSRAKAFVQQLTLDEKAGIVTGTAGPCVGNIAPIPRLGFGGLCLQDGPAAIRQATYASVFSAGLTAAASWDKSLIHARGQFMAEEFRGKGAHIALGPVCGPLGRTAYGGRNWEGFSPDPYLTGVAMEETILGMQSVGVQATAKHYIGNEQETQRNPSTRNGTTIEAISSNMDDRTMHELYLWPFANAVHAGVASVMCSYNRLNQSYGCQNSKTLNGLLKDELGFQGYVMSDWGATHAGVASVEAGLDMNMPGGIAFTVPNPSFWGQNLTLAVQNGTIPESRVDDMVERVMTPYYYLKQDQDFPTVDPSEVGLNFFPASSYTGVYDLNGTANRDVRANHAQHIREMGAAGTVLLKNVNGTLPLKAPKNIGVFGNDAGDLTEGLYSLTTGGLSSSYFGYEFGTLDIGGGSGTGRHSYIVPPLDAIKARAAQDQALVQYELDNTLITSGGLSTIYPQPEVCIVFTKTWASEGIDRLDLELNWNGTGVVNAVAARCNNTIVVTHSSGQDDLSFADHPNVTAILAAHYPGQETGNSIVDILYGSVNPSGKLPYTLALNPDDYNTKLVNSTALATTTDPNAWQDNFVEGTLIDYRYFDRANKTVRYEFGFGLSYTTFAISDIQVQANSSLASRPDSSIPTQPGGNPGLWEIVASVSTTVSNTGSVAGAAVPQLYLGLSGGDTAEPVKVLRGFEKVMLQPGESQQVVFPLLRRDLSSWDATLQDWVLAKGQVGVSVGFSSRDLPLTGSLIL